MDFAAFVTAVLQDRAVQTIIAVAVCVVGLVIVGYVGQRVAADARLSKYSFAFNLLREKAADWIITVKYGTIDLADYKGVDYNDKAEELSVKFGRKIDPRMAFVLDRLEDEVTKKLGLKIELEEVLALAERKYNELRFASNGLVLNPNDVPAVVDPQAAAETVVQRALRKTRVTPATVPPAE